MLKLILKDIQKWFSWLKREPVEVYVIKVSVAADGYNTIVKEIKSQNYKAVAVQFQYMNKEIGNIFSYNVHLIKELQNVLSNHSDSKASSPH